MRKNEFLIALSDVIKTNSKDYDLSKASTYRPLKNTINKLVQFVDKKIEDFRKVYLVQYPLSEIMILCFFAILQNADTYADIYYFGKDNLTFLRKFSRFSQGIPSHDTVRRFFMHISNEQLEETLIYYVTYSLKNARKHYDKKGMLKHIIIDGKSLNGSGRLNNSNRKKPNIASLNVYDAGSGVVLVSKKYNSQEKETCELNAAKEVLKHLNLSNCIVSLDALHFQKDIMNTIFSKKGHFLIGIKRNQEELYDNIKLFFETECDEIIKKFNDPKEIKKIGWYKKESEKSHNKIITREWFVIDEIDYFKNKKWDKLKSIVFIKKTCFDLIKNDYDETELRYYATSLENPDLIIDIVRSHWRIENNLHWHLDVSMKEDESLISDSTAAINFSIFRKTCLIFLKLVKASLNDGTSVKGARKRLGWAPDKMLIHLFDSLSDSELLEKLSLK